MISSLLLARVHFERPEKRVIKVHFKHCLMQRFGQCMIEKLGDPNDPSMMEGIDWLCCSKCESWYHSVCCGLCKQYLDKVDFEFVCICTEPPYLSEMYDLALGFFGHNQHGYHYIQSF